MVYLLIAALACFCLGMFAQRQNQKLLAGYFNGFGITFGIVSFFVFVKQLLQSFFP